MEHNLHDSVKVREIYLSDGNINGSKNLLIVNEDGTVILEWCMGDKVEVQEKPIFVRIGKEMRVEYGTPNLFNIRQMLPFMDSFGRLDVMWERIM